MANAETVDWGYLAAAYRLGIVTSDEIKRAAETAIAQGHYSQALDEIASSYEPILSDVGPQLLTVLNEQGVPFPEPLAAALTVTRRTMERIASGDVHPHEAIHGLIFDVYDQVDTTVHAEFSGARSHGLSDMIGAFYTYWELEDLPDVSYDGRSGDAALHACQRHMRTLAQDWLRQHQPN